MAGNANSGRKSKTLLTRDTTQLIGETAPDAVRYLQDAIRGNLGTITKTVYRKSGEILTTEEVPVQTDSSRVEACKYIINQFMGMPKQRQDIDISAESGSGVTFMFINPPPVELDAVEVKELPAPEDPK